MEYHKVTSFQINKPEALVRKLNIETGCLPPLCNLLTVTDAAIVLVALNGLENILRAGEQESRMMNGVNPYAVMIEECSGTPDDDVTVEIARANRSSFVIGLDKIEFLQSHSLKEIYKKSYEIIERYFGSEEEDLRVAPSVAADSQQFQLSDQSVPMGGFQF